MQRFSKLSVALLLILCLGTNGIFVIAEGDEGISELLQAMVQYLEIGTGDFDQYELTGYVGSSGYAQWQQRIGQMSFSALSRKKQVCDPEKKEKVKAERGGNS